MKTIELPDGLEEIGKEAFIFTGLKIVVFLASVTKIKEKAFADCGSLKELRFPNGFNVQEIHIEAFWGCSNLKHIVIGNNSITIEEFIANYKPSICESNAFESSYPYEIDEMYKHNGWLAAFIKIVRKMFEDITKDTIDKIG